MVWHHRVVSHGTGGKSTLIENRAVIGPVKPSVGVINQSSCQLRFSVAVPMLEGQQRGAGIMEPWFKISVVLLVALCVIGLMTVLYLMITGILYLF